MTWGIGRLAWAVAVVLLAIGLYEFSELNLGAA
jgi:hypothetical protein